MNDEELLKRGPLATQKVDEFLTSIPKSQIFTVKFIKENGAVRKMVCRRDIHKGGGSSIENRPNLVGVFDVYKRGFRCFDKRCVLDVVVGDSEASSSSDTKSGENNE